MNFLKTLYFKLFNFVSIHRIEKGDVPVWVIHVHLSAILLTGILMWGYAFVAMEFMASPVPMYVGLAASTFHVLSVFLWRVTNNPYLISNLCIGAGIAHQSAYAYFNGGFESNILVWYSILPILGGVIAGTRGIITWTLGSFVVASGFLLLHLSGHNFPQELSNDGKLISMALLIYGFLICGTGLISLFLFFSEKSKNNLSKKSDQVQDLLRVLIHDISNPLFVAQAQAEMISVRNEDEEKTKVRMSKLISALDLIEDLSTRVRNYHVDELDQSKFKRELCGVEECVEHINLIFEAQLLEKDIHLKFEGDMDLKFKVNKEILKNQILLNLTSNAIKFTEPGGEIVFGARKTPGEIHIFVKDSGIGMDTETLARLRKFGSARSTKGTIGESGTGFGLRIVRSFVDKLDGGLDVYSIPKTENSEEHGTEFVVKLPA